MSVITIDLTRSGDKTCFSDSSEEDISYAKTFWQSVQLQPPLESRLVSSDIKQRLKIAPPGNHSTYYAHSTHEDSPALKDFLMRAKTIEQMDRFDRLQQFSAAREKDREFLQKRRQERTKREEISAKFRPVKKDSSSSFTIKTDQDDSGQEDEDPQKLMEELDKFDKMRNLDTPGSVEED